MVISKLAALTLNYVRAAGKSKTLLTKAPQLKNLKAEKLFYNAAANCADDIAYHGSPFKFDVFDCAKIGEGEGLSRHGFGIYFFRGKKAAPFYANIRSKDAPIHIGSTKHLETANPHVYTVSGFKNLNLKPVTPREARKITPNQAEFEKLYPEIDGFEISGNEICVFPKSVQKLTIKYRDELEDFVMMNRNYPFREWTTDKNRLAKFI